MLKRTYSIGDMFTHPLHGVGIVIEVKKKMFVSCACCVEWTTYCGGETGTAWHHTDQIDWESSGMKHYPVKT